MISGCVTQQWYTKPMAWYTKIMCSGTLNQPSQSRPDFTLIYFSPPPPPPLDQPRPAKIFFWKCQHVKGTKTKVLVQTPHQKLAWMILYEFYSKKYTPLNHAFSPEARNPGFGRGSSYEVPLLGSTQPCMEDHRARAVLEILEIETAKFGHQPTLGVPPPLK